MKQIQEIIKNKVALYTLGVGVFLALVAMPGAITPKKQEPSLQNAKAEMETQDDKYATSPASMSYNKGRGCSGKYDSVSSSLSPKSRKAFNTLSDTDKERVKMAHDSGKSSEKEMKKIFDEDQRAYVRQKSCN